MAPQRAQNYARLAKRSGLFGAICFFIWMLSTLVAVGYLSEKRHVVSWADVIIGLLGITTIACIVISLTAVILNRFKPKAFKV